MDACAGAFFNHDPHLLLLLHGSIPVLCIFIRSLLASKAGKQVARARRQVLAMGETEIKWRLHRKERKKQKADGGEKMTEILYLGVIWSIVQYMV